VGARDRAVSRGWLIDTNVVSEWAIAATCLAGDLVLATRNLADFEELGVELFAPFG
jgi:predicted nucleic acid-binding protein